MATVLTFGEQGGQVTFILETNRIIVLEDGWRVGRPPKLKSDVCLEADSYHELITAMYAEYEKYTAELKEQDDGEVQGTSGASGRGST